MKLSKLKKNPRNPRVIRDQNFARLKQSITDFSRMFEGEPIIVDENDMILAGNMRVEALKSLGYKEVPDEWVRRLGGLTDEEKERIVIISNTHYGEWDWDMLANEFSHLPLPDLGLDVPAFAAIEAPEFKEYTEDVENDVQYIECPQCQHRFPK